MTMNDQTNGLSRYGREINDPKQAIELCSTHSSARWLLTDSSVSNWTCESVYSPKFRLPLSVWSTTPIYIRFLSTKLAFKWHCLWSETGIWVMQHAFLSTLVTDRQQCQ